jgi:hypothetical protein
MIPTPTFLNREDAAAWLRADGLRCTPQGLADAATKGIGPRYSVIHGRAVYRVTDLRAWVEQEAARPPRARRQRERLAAVSAE